MMTIHRFIPASEKHGQKTACGIKLRFDGYQIYMQADDGGIIRVSAKGEHFDCPRCRNRLELRHGDTFATK